METNHVPEPMRPIGIVKFLDTYLSHVPIETHWYADANASADEMQADTEWPLEQDDGIWIPTGHARDGADVDAVVDGVTCRIPAIMTYVDMMLNDPCDCETTRPNPTMGDALAITDAMEKTAQTKNTTLGEDVRAYLRNSSLAHLTERFGSENHIDQDAIDAFVSKPTNLAWRIRYRHSSSKDGASRLGTRTFKTCAKAEEYLTESGFEPEDGCMYRLDDIEATIEDVKTPL